MGRPIKAIDCTTNKTRPTTSEISDDDQSSTKSLTPTRKRHAWLIEERVTLALLAGYYDLRWLDVLRIFHLCHMEHVPDNERISQNACIAQWNWMRAYFDEEDALKELAMASPPWGSDKRKLIKLSALQKNAEILRIELPIRSDNRFISTQRQQLQTSSKRSNMDIDVRADGFSSSDCGTDFLPKSSKRPRLDLDYCTPVKASAATKVADLMTPPKSLRSNKGLPLQNIRAAYRSFSRLSQGLNSSKTGFVAGSFVNSDVIPPSPDPQDQFFVKEALRHISKHHSGPTPFISLSYHLLPCLHRALHTQEFEAYIATVDVYEANRTGVVHCATSLGLKPDHYYVAKGELLCWGAISSQSIVSVVSISDLVAAMPKTPSDPDPFSLEFLRHARSTGRARKKIHRDPLPASHQIGKAIGTLLNVLCPIRESVDTGLLHGIVYSILADWKIRFMDKSSWMRWGFNKTFREGVECGYWGISTGQLLNLSDSLAESREKRSDVSNITPSSDHEDLHKEEAIDVDDDADILSAQGDTPDNGFTNDFMVELQDVMENVDIEGSAPRVDSHEKIQSGRFVDRVRDDSERYESETMDSEYSARRGSRAEQRIVEVLTELNDGRFHAGEDVPLADVNNDESNNRAIGADIGLDILREMCTRERMEQDCARHARMYSWTGM